MRLSKTHKVFLMRLAVSLLVLGLIYFVILRPTVFDGKESNDTVHTQPASDFQNNFHQHYLAVSSLLLVDGSDKAAGYTIANIRTQIDETRAAVEKQAESDKYALALLSREKDVLSSYDSAYESLEKLLLYQIEGDLGRLDTKKQADDIASRASAAADALENIRKNNQIISNSTGSKISESIGCLVQISQSAKDNKANPAQIMGCDNKYIQLRRSAVNDLISLLNSGADKQFFDDFANYFRP